MKTIELRIHETGRMSLKEETSNLNNIKESFETVEQLKEYLVERYGKIPQGRKKIYTGTNQNPKVIGFLHSFWNQDISHNSAKWYQTDWIEFWEQDTIKVYNIKLK
jgi:hypothetical protein